MAPQLIGRGGDRETLRALLSARGVVTLVGPGGVGKTTLARSLVEDGEVAALVDLSEAHTGAGAIATLAEALGCRPTLEALGDALDARRGQVLALDNLEQLGSVAAELVAALRAAAPETGLLLTSRRPLGLREEQVLALEGLGLPVEAQAREVEASDAGRLFLSLARRASARYQLRPEDAPAIAELLATTGGLPLAIEITASRVRSMSPRDLVSRGAGLLDLRHKDAEVPERHRSLRATLEGSWTLLSEAEREALVACAVFRGGFTLDAAEAVLGEGALGEAALDALDALVDWSLLDFDDARRRYRLAVSVRQFLLERGAPAQLDAAARRHLGWCAQLGASDAHAAGRMDPGYAARLARERENLIAAIDLGLSVGDVPAAALAGLALVRGNHGAAWLSGRPERLLREALEPATRVELLLLGGQAVVMLGDPDLARALLQEALGLAEDLERPDVAVDAANALGLVARTQGDLADAERYLERALAGARALRDQVSLGRALNNLSLVHLDLGDEARVGALQEQALACHRASGRRSSEARVLGNLGLHALRLGDLARARERLERSLEVWAELGVSADDAYISSAGLSEVSAQGGDLEGALQLGLRASAGAERAGDRHWAAWQCCRNAELRVQLAQGEEADAALREVRVLLERASLPDVEVLWRRVKSARCLQLGESAAALRHGEQAVARASELGPADLGPALLCLAQARAHVADDLGALEALGRVDEARLHAWDRAAVQALRGGLERGVQVASDGAWLQRQGTRADLSARASLRGLLGELARRAQAEEPPAALEVLFEAGWPGQRVRPESAQNRVWVGLASLRKLGLGEDLLRVEGGYRLSEAVRVVEV